MGQVAGEEHVALRQGGTSKHNRDWALGVRGYKVRNFHDAAAIFKPLIRWVVDLWRSMIAFAMKTLRDERTIDYVKNRGAGVVIGFDGNPLRL